MVIGKADGKIRAQAVGIVKAREVLIRHPRPAVFEIREMLVPVGQGSFPSALDDWRIWFQRAS